jgi:flagellar biosynthesis protein FliQ
LAIRKCPVCLTKLSAIQVVTRSYDLVCPTDGRALEVSRISRNISIFAGLIAGYVVWYFSAQSAVNHQALGWVFPILYSIIAFGVVAPLVLMLTADLSLKTELPPPEIHSEEPASHGGHGKAHH